MNFGELGKQGKTVICKETKTNDHPQGWEFWGKRQTPEETVFVWRKIVTLEEAEQHELENEY